ncbi:hypothetical protein [Chishuiella sp.]|uniref:hypothetical protein n=1 Tax=Chishuiella sp. TaxID=1969467 RepID=UPI0028AE94E2|nr:hypothetical protein [Chishuiella sp.]
MNKFDQHIKNKLFQPHVPPLDAWENIEKELNKKKKKNRIIPLLYFVGSFAACVLIGISLFYFNLLDTNQNELIHHSDKIVKKDASKTMKKSINKSDLDNEKSLLINHSDDAIVSIEKTVDYNKKIIKIKSENSLINQIYSRSDEFNNENFSIENSNSESTNQRNKDYDYQENNSIENKILSENDNQNDLIKQEKSLELVLKEEEKKQNEKITIKSSPILAVSSYVNPMKMLGNKSILSDEFNDLSVKNNTTIAYGAKVSIRLNERINIRSGISKIDLEQSTDNVNYGRNSVDYLLSSSSSSQNFNYHNNIKYNNNVRVLSTNYELNALTSSPNSTQLEQKISFLEIPLELEYKLGMFKKINLLGTVGGSYYVVTKNSISVNDNNRVQYKIGTAANLNNSSYSANLGLKLQYLLSEKASIDLEPNYRYMINPLQNVDNKNPSLLGINMGFSFKF